MLGPWFATVLEIGALYSRADVVTDLPRYMTIVQVSAYTSDVAKGGGSLAKAPA